MTDKEKKILPFMIIGFLFAIAAVIYFMVIRDTNAPPTKAPIQKHVSNGQVSQVNLNQAGVQESALTAVGNAQLGGPNVLSEIQNVQHYEYTDSNGNIVQEIIEPDPMTVDSSNHLLISDDNIRIIDLLKNNLLLEVQAKNEQLKAQKKMNQMNYTGEVVPTNVNGQYAHIQSPSESGFTELGTTTTLLSSVSVDSMELEEQFARISLASITVNEKKELPNVVSAWVRYDGKLFKATEGRELGDFVITKVTESNISIKYAPANVTKKLGHSGFES